MLQQRIGGGIERDTLNEGGGGDGRDGIKQI